jgi:hypothetical protein
MIMSRNGRRKIAIRIARGLFSSVRAAIRIRP